jgi:hypothetical protein
LQIGRMVEPLEVQSHAGDNGRYGGDLDARVLSE